MLALLLASEDGSVLEQTMHLFGNPAHYIYHFVLEFITAVILYPFAKVIWRKALSRHDKEHHPNDTH